MTSIRRLVLTAGIAVISLLGVPAIANAVVYCVPNDTIALSCTSGQGKATIQDALDAAAATTGVADTVRIGAGSYSEADLTYDETTSTNVVNVIGAGTGLTALAIPNTTGNKTGLLMDAPTGSSVSSLAMTIPANADSLGDSGIELEGGAVFGHDLLVTGPSATNARGIALRDGSGVDTSTINLQFGSTENVAVFGNGNSSVADSTLHANDGLVSTGGPTKAMTVDRTTVQASAIGGTNDSGAMNISNSLIDLGSNSNAIGVAAQNLNNGISAITANLDGDTIVGTGTNSVGVRALADSAVSPADDPNDNTNDGESSTVTVANTILSGQTHSLEVQADRGEIATMNTSYSNYDSATKIVTSDFTAGGGTGTASLSESHQTNDTPGFVSSSDFHLASGSALIDAGDPAGPPFGEQDIDGDNREILGKDGCAPRRDIGADEFVPLSPPTLLDCIPPDTSILSGPSGTTTDNTPTFTFASTESPSTFRCSVDGGGFSSCSSPFTGPALGDGAHTFAVEAVDSSLNVDPTPATRSFAVDTTAPETTIGSHPKPKTKNHKATFTFSSSEAGSSFLCSYDGKPYAPCSSPFTTPKLKKGRHRFDVVATDAAGNRDQSAATFLWKIKRKQR